VLKAKEHQQRKPIALHPLYVLDPFPALNIRLPPRGGRLEPVPMNIYVWWVDELGRNMNVLIYVYIYTYMRWPP